MRGSRKTQTNESKRRKIPYCLSIIFRSKWKANSSLRPMRGNSCRKRSILDIMEQVKKDSNSAVVAERKHSHQSHEPLIHSHSITADAEERDLVNAFSNLDLYCSHNPAAPAAWKGGFIILDDASYGQYFGGLLAQSPGSDFSQQLPPEIHMYTLERSSVWDDLLKEDEKFLMYFLPAYDKYRSSYQLLLDIMDKEDFLLTSCIDDVQLIVFSSGLLHPDAKRAVLQNEQGKELATSKGQFLCGVFLVGRKRLGESVLSQLISFHALCFCRSCVRK